MVLEMLAEYNKCPHMAKDPINKGSTNMFLSGHMPILVIGDQGDR